MLGHALEVIPLHQKTFNLNFHRSVTVTASRGNHQLLMRTWEHSRLRGVTHLQEKSPIHVTYLVSNTMEMIMFQNVLFATVTTIPQISSTGILIVTIATNALWPIGKSVCRLKNQNPISRSCIRENKFETGHALSRWLSYLHCFWIVRCGFFVTAILFHMQDITCKIDLYFFLELS